MSKEKIQELINLSSQLYENILEDEFMREEQKSIEIMQNVEKNLKDRRFIVSVIAAMKAGKSTTFNALLGRDLLPNESAACTTAITEIKHSKVPVEVVQKVYRDGNVVELTATDDLSLEENFHADVRGSRNRNEVNRIEKYYVETPVAAIETSEYGELVQNFILVDTPGPNEASVDGFDTSELQRIALEQLRHSDALIMLFDYQAYKSDTNARILKSIFENREDLEKDQEKIYFLINKIDVMSPRDGTIEEVVQKVKSLIREYAPVIKEPQVFAFSAKKACLARSFIKGNITEEALGELKKYGVEYNKTIEFDGKTYSVSPEPEEYVQDLLETSNILTIEKNIIERMFSQASGKMLENAYERIQQVTDNITNMANTQIEVSTQNEQELSVRVNESKKEIEQLRSETESLKDFTRTHLKELMNETTVVVTEIYSKVEEAITTAFPTSGKIQGREKKQLQEQLTNIRKHIDESIQFTVNREVDKIQRLIIEKQAKINHGLNGQFMQLATKANETVGKHITLEFQVFNMDDLALDSIGIELNSTEDIVGTGGGASNVDPFDNIVKNALAGAGSGLVGGIVLPGIGNIAGALVGGVAGIISGILQNKSVEESQMYLLDLTKAKETILQEVQVKIEDLIEEINTNIYSVNEKYMGYVEKQMNGFIQNLKNQLDTILADFMKNKHNIEKHVHHMQTIQQKMNDYQEQVDQIRSREQLLV